MKRMDVYYSTFGVPAGSLTSAGVTIYTSWDGTKFAESNLLAACGPNRVVDPGGPDRVAVVNGVRMNSPANFVS